MATRLLLLLEPRRLRAPLLAAPRREAPRVSAQREHDAEARAYRLTVYRLTLKSVRVGKCTSDSRLGCVITAVL